MPVTIFQNPQAPPAGSFFLPAAPTAVTGAVTTLVMMGLGSTVQFTPASTGKLQVVWNGTAGSLTTAAQINVQGRWGPVSGGVPANNAAVTGTVFGQGSKNIKSNGTPPTSDFTTIGGLTGLAVGTAYWFDLAIQSTVGADAAEILNLFCSITEMT